MKNIKNINGAATGNRVFTQKNLTTILKTIFVVLTVGGSCMLAGADTVEATDVALRVDAGQEWVIAWPAAGLAVEQYAAEELATYVAKATGCRTRVVAEDKLPTPDAANVYVGATAYARDQKQYRDDLPQEAYVIKTANSKLFIFGDDSSGVFLKKRDRRLGTLYGVYDFLENELNIAWIWPGETGEHVPRRQGLMLPALDRQSAPDFIIRWFDVGYGRWEGSETMPNETSIWLKRMRLAWVTPGWFGHSWGTHVLNRPEIKDHPEWLALWGGERRGPHICTSNPELRAFIVEGVLENASKKGNRIVSISPSDGYGFCECENCRALDPADTDYSQSGLNLSNRHWDYATDIARQVKKRDPGLSVGMFAYTNYRQPPTNIERMEENMFLSFTFSTAYFVKPEMREKTYAEISAWEEKGIKIVGREYWGMHYWLDLPWLFTAQIAEAIPLLHKQGLVAMYGETGKNYATQGPNYYLAAHLMWNAEGDSTKIMDRFYGAFGPAEEAIRAYYATYEKHLVENEAKIPGFGYRELLNAWPEILPMDVVERAGSHLERATKAVADDPAMAARVRVVEIGHEYTTVMVELLSLYRTLGRAGVPLWNFGPEGDTAEAIHYKLPGDKMVPEAAAYWQNVPHVELIATEKIALLRRARDLGEARVRILDEHRDLPAVSRGLYQYTVDRGIRPWHRIVQEELAKLEEK